MADPFSLFLLSVKLPCRDTTPGAIATKDSRKEGREKNLRVCKFRSVVMKISVTTFTIALSTFSVCLASGGNVKHETTKLGMRRHIISSKRSNQADSDPQLHRPGEQDVGINQYTPTSSNASEHEHRLEKRGYEGQGTYFQPGQGKLHASPKNFH